MKWLATVGLLVYGLWMLAACAQYRQGQRYFDLASKAGFSEIRFSNEEFAIYGALKHEDRVAEILVVYLEGDGAAWRRKGEPAPDPTPQQPLALLLALEDPAAGVLYLARPGQFQRAEDPHCRPAYWSLARYSETVVKAYSLIIERVKRRKQVQKIGLIGYSGGGVLAALLAARRDDVVWLATVASNLDHRLWCAEHQVTFLRDSLEPKNFGDRLENIPQIHFIGGRDQIVSQKVIQSFISAMADKKSVELVVMKGFDHHCCWQKAWPGLLEMIPGR